MGGQAKPPTPAGPADGRKEEVEKVVSGKKERRIRLQSVLADCAPNRRHPLL